MWGFGFMFKRFFTVSSNDLFKSARLKIDRASEHIADVNKVLAEERPFRYILETDAKTGRRSTYAERNEAVIDRLALRSSDAVQNLRDAIDHAYTAVVAPFAASPREERAVQFPFSETAARLKEAAHNRLAHKVSPEFRDAILDLKPHGEAGGNNLLYFMSALNNPGKHATLIPIGYFVEMRVGEVRKRVIPDFLPGMSDDSTIGFGQNRIDASWSGQRFSLDDWVMNRVPANGILKQEVDIPVDVTFEGRANGGLMLTVPTLYQFVDVTKAVVGTISRFA